MLDSLASNKTKSGLDMEVVWISLARVGLPSRRGASLTKRSHRSCCHPYHLLSDRRATPAVSTGDSAFMNTNLLRILKEKYWRGKKMALYKPLLFLVMHRTVYELTDVTQCPVFMAGLTKAQLEDRPGPLPHYCNVLPCQNRVLYFNISYLQLYFTTY